MSVVQLSYVVEDLGAAASQWAVETGAGPFFVHTHMPISVRHRGQGAVLDHSAAFGQWGDVMIELVEHHEIHPPSLADALRNRSGLHHVAWFAPISLAAEQERLAGLRWEEVLSGEANGGVKFAFYDCPALGHLVEIYEASPPLRDLYAKVASAAEGWDGADPVRPIRALYRTGTSGGHTRRGKATVGWEQIGARHHADS